MMPQWYYSSPDLDEYMEVAICGMWDKLTVGTLLEAFAIRGGTVAGLSSLQNLHILSNTSLQVL